MYVLMNLGKFREELNKVLFIDSYLEGDVKAWFRLYLRDYIENEEGLREDETKALFTSYNKFKR